MMNADPSRVWLVYCTGRPTQTSAHSSRSAAEAAAERLARQWPGHTFTVFEGHTDFTADRGPRPEAPRAPPGTQHF